MFEFIVETGHPKSEIELAEQRKKIYLKEEIDQVALIIRHKGDWVGRLSIPAWSAGTDNDDICVCLLLSQLTDMSHIFSSRLTF